MEKVIKIHGEATVKGTGNNDNKLCKPVYIVELNKPFDSVKECASFLGVTSATVSAALNRQIKAVRRRYHIRPLSAVTETVDEILTYNRNVQQKLEDEIAAIKRETEMDEYLAWKRRKEEIHTTREKIALVKQEIADANVKLAELEAHLTELKGDDF